MDKDNNVETKQPNHWISFAQYLLKALPVQYLLNTIRGTKKITVLAKSIEKWSQAVFFLNAPEKKKLNKNIFYYTN